MPQLLWLTEHYFLMSIKYNCTQQPGTALICIKTVLGLNVGLFTICSVKFHNFSQFLQSSASIIPLNKVRTYLVIISSSPFIKLYFTRHQMSRLCTSQSPLNITQRNTMYYVGTCVNHRYYLCEMQVRFQMRALRYKCSFYSKTEHA